jgi:creatinine amidohydrolase/Fe(II)-dependent formamide hydrolase-like protein
VKMKGQKSFPELPKFEVIADAERFFPSGVIGDPTVASPEKGRRINTHVVKGVAKLVEELKN